MIVVASAVLLKTSCPCVSVITCGELARLKLIVEGVVAAFACWIAQRKVPDVRLAGSLVLVTVNVDGISRRSRS